MSENPYSSPASEIEVKENLPPRPVRGITIGVLVDLVGSVIVGLVSGFTYAFFLASQGVAPDKIQATLENVDPLSLYGGLNVFLGLSVSCLGGFYCAKISRARNYLYPGIMAAVMTVIVAALSWGSLGDTVHLALSALTVVAILLGARFHIKSKQ